MNSRPFLVLTVCLFVLALSMALYVWELRKRADSELALPPAPQTVVPPGTGESKQVTLWVAYDDPGIVRSRNTSIVLPAERQQKAEEILRALLTIYSAKDSPHRLPPAAEVRNVYFVDPGLVVVDVNSDLANGQTSGVLAEELTIASIVRTLAANQQGMSRVKFLVNGKASETLAGHVDLSRSYDPVQISDLIKQLSSE